MRKTNLALVVASLAALLSPAIALSQKDPGVRSQTGVNAGQPLASVATSANDFAFFQTGLAQFIEHQTVTGDNPGLGPRFNLDSCGSCHKQPGVRRFSKCRAEPAKPGNRKRDREWQHQHHPVLRPSQRPGARSALPVLLRPIRQCQLQCTKRRGRRPVHRFRPVRCRELQSAATRI